MAKIKVMKGAPHDSRMGYGVNGVGGAGASTYGVGGVTGGATKVKIASVAGGPHDKRMGYGCEGVGKK